MPEPSHVFAAMLRYWRTRRGLSQLDLALTAEVSSRHVSYLETGRSRPGRDMVLLLAATLDVPLRDRNVMLREAGFEAAFPEPGLDALDAGVEHALSVLLRQHEPFPALVLDRGYDVLRTNGAAARLVERIVGAVPARWNAVRALFAPAGVRDVLADWETPAREAIARLRRESLQAPNDERLRGLLADVLDAPGVPEAWRTPDLSLGAAGALDLRFHLDGEDLAFVTTMLAFHAPQNVTLDELQVEYYVPRDDATASACERLLGP